MCTYDDPFQICLQENISLATCNVVSICLSVEEIDLSLLEVRELLYRIEYCSNYLHFSGS